MKAYLDTHRGMPVASKTEKPEKLNRLPDGHEENELIELHEKYDLKEYEANSMEVENIARYPFNKGIWYWGGAWYFQPTSEATTEFVIPEGQQVEIEITENGCRVTKII